MDLLFEAISSVTDMGGSDDCLDPKYWKRDPYMNPLLWPDPFNPSDKRFYKIETDFEPDEWIFGVPCYEISDSEFCNFFTGRKVQWRWIKQTKNEKIKKFVSKNPGKTFFVKVGNQYYKIYSPTSKRGVKEMRHINVYEKDKNTLIIEFKSQEGFFAFMKGYKGNKNFWALDERTKEMLDVIQNNVKHRYIFVKFNDNYIPLK